MLSQGAGTEESQVGAYSTVPDREDTTVNFRRGREEVRWAKRKRCHRTYFCCLCCCHLRGGHSSRGLTVKKGGGNGLEGQGEGSECEGQRVAASASPMHFLFAPEVARLKNGGDAPSRAGLALHRCSTNACFFLSCPKARSQASLLT